MQITISHADMSGETVASHSAMRPWTLQRAMRREGLSFSAVQSRFAKGRAQRLLSEGDARVEESARSLGHKDSRRFRRIFNRWSGVSSYRCQRPQRGSRDLCPGGTEPR
ncbi:helix-turn-helix domain-containing protein [Ruegeria pomeroyi]|uniref:Helix-turn-helix domain-containing protein n=2 Tax=Ruegeria pomeroyi TaxID=89184 RepID=A0A9Q3WIX9_9RHOB|nr:helix-turn-helix domain-containing protein [Ruegeria pomeroyi]